jgi:hypothetical protein
MQMIRAMKHEAEVASLVSTVEGLRGLEMSLLAGVLIGVVIGAVVIYVAMDRKCQSSRHATRLETTAH